MQDSRPGCVDNLNLTVIRQIGRTEAKSSAGVSAPVRRLWSKASMSERSPAQLPESGQAGPDHSDQRAAQRFTLLIRNAKIVFPCGEFLCVIRDVSATGLRIKVFHALPDEQPEYLEMATGERYGVSVVWAEDGQMGLRFLEQQDVACLIREEGPYPKRSLRIMLQLPARLRAGGETSDATILNLSQYGANVECRERLAIEQQLILSARLLPDLDAKVRWRKGDQYGLSFHQTFSMDQLALLVARLQAPHLAPPVSATGAQTSLA